VRVAALAKAIDALHENGFAWNDTYVATTEPGHQVRLVMAGIGGDQFMARAETEILIGQVSDLPQPHPARGEAFILEPTTWERAREPPQPKSRT
jgi:cell filamentation protein